LIETIIAAIIILGVLVFVHELGHFLAAKQFGIGVEKFSLGFGPKIIGKTVGETEYMLSAIPLGGYVKLMGQEVSDFPVSKDNTPEEQDESETPEEPPFPPEKSFALRPVRQRLWVVLAGPVFNLIFAILVFAIVNLMGAPYIIASIAKTVSGSPAEEAGMQPGDEIVSIDGAPINRWDQLVGIVQQSEGKALSLQVRRGDKVIPLTLRPRVMTSKSPITGQEIKRTMIGVQTEGVLRLGPNPNGETPDPITAVWRGTRQTWNIISQTGQAVSLIFKGTIPAREALGGPILIGERAGWHCQAGAVNCLFFASFLSINLAILNLLPIPVLDGGHVFFYLIEAIRRRPMSIRTREVAQQLGFIFIIGLMIFAFYNDIMRFIAPVP
jgi:regulator of sigma E protease